MRKRAIMIAMAIAVMCNTERVKGVSVSDVITLYKNENEEKRKAVSNTYEIKKNEYEEVELAYEEEKKIVEEAKAFDTMYTTAEEYMETKKGEIDGKIEAILNENIVIAEEINQSIDKSLVFLMRKDVQYKKNLEEIESLLREKEEYVLTEAVKVDIGKLEKLQDKVNKNKLEGVNVAEEKSIGFEGELDYPVEGETSVTSPFGDRVDPFNKSSIRFHGGIDLRAKKGTKVKTVFGGKVYASGYTPLGGYYVSVDHGNGLRTYYCHLQELKCRVGDIVKQNEEIALSGDSGSRTTGPHLHLGVYINGNPVDPDLLFKKGR